MLKKNLKVICLDVTEDYYRYNGTFKLCDEEKSVDMDLTNLNDDKINEIKDVFNLDETMEEIRKEIMSMVLEVVKIESRIVEGKTL